MMFARFRSRASVVHAMLSRALRRGMRLAVRQPGALFGMVSIAVLWIGVLYSLSVERQAAIDNAFDDTSNFARAFQEQIAGITRAIDQTLLYVRASYMRAPDQFDIALWSEHGEFLTNSAFQVAIIGKDGFLRASSFGPVTSPVDLREREHFRVQAKASEDRLFISKPVTLHQNGQWAIQFTRRMVESDGSFAGVVSVSFDPFYLSRFYNTLNLGSGGVVVLIGTDGIVRARAPDGQQTIGHSLTNTPLMQSFAQKANGTIAAVSVIDGVRRFYSYRAIEGYPLLVAVGVSENDALAEYYSDRRSYLTMAAVVSVLLLIVVALFVRHQARLDRARSALLESEARYAENSRLLGLTLENMTQGIMMMDARMTLRVSNRRAAELMDLPEELLASRPPLQDLVRTCWLRGEFGPHVETFEAWFSGFMASHSEAMDIREHRVTNGTIVEICSKFLSDGGVVRTFTDITERKRVEATLRAARDEATHSAQVKSEFLAMMSHEIRTPMSGLLGIIELLRDTKLDVEQGQMVELVHGSATSLLRILNDVLNLAKIDAGAVELALEPVDLRHLVTALVDTMAPNAMGNSLTLVGDVADDVPAYVSTDAVRLREVLGNLLGNAIKFTASGSVRLDITRADSPAGTPGLVFAVTDTGIGIAADAIERLFEPFSQADASTTKLFGGTGLGLTISRRLARLLGGDITVASVPGQGSIFTLTMPLVVAQSPVTVNVGDTVFRDDSIGPIRILVAEDQLTNRWLIQRQLERLGCTVTAVEDGRAALMAFDRAEYDLVITDCHMPGIDGIELVRMIRLAEATCGVPPVPILGLTADVTAAMHERCILVGMNDVVAKPIDLRRLHAAITRILDTGVVCDTRDEVRQEAEVFDPSTYRELFADDSAAGSEWLEAYLVSAIDLAARIRQAAVSGDRSGLGASAHRLAGASLSVGAMRLGALARELEAAAPNASDRAIHELADDLGGRFRSVQAAITDFLPVPVPVT
jgi:signal transduction histidine kinase/DNA-binding NarL/FixJ family response regulator